MNVQPKTAPTQEDAGNLPLSSPTASAASSPSAWVEQVRRKAPPVDQKRREALGLFAHLALQTPSAEEIKETRREAWTEERARKEFSLE